jgi:predicted methyltransferase
MSRLFMQRRTATAALFAALLPRRAISAGDDDSDVARLAATIGGAQRSEANRTRDAARHPFETLRFFGLAPAQTVIEIAPGGGWYTEILAPYLRERGHFYAAVDAPDAASESARRARARFEEKMAKEPGAYDRVKIGTLPAGRSSFADIAPPGGADLVLTFRNVHNWLEAGHLDETLRAFHAVLKPGGVLGVEEHRAPAGTPLPRIIATGYVPEDLVIERARAVGFELAGRSEINANPRDTKDHANGVWSLPPTLRGGDVDRARYVAIGESDRMTLKFIKLGR